MKEFPGGEKIPDPPQELQLWYGIFWFFILSNWFLFLFVKSMTEIHTSNQEVLQFQPIIYHFFRLNAIEVSSEKLRKDKKSK